MEIKRSTITENGSCNFCMRGEYNGYSMTYPYNNVTTATRKNHSGVFVVICDDCLKELIEFNQRLERE